MRPLVILSLLSLFTAVSFAAPDDAEEQVRNCWFEHCGRCHGDDGKAKTTLGVRLKIKDYSSKAQQALFSDEQALVVIKDGKIVEGKKKMPGYSSELTEAQLQELLQYLRRMAKNP